ncbi:N-formylglutamate amidohydrolase [Luteimonas sp. MC1572]|uniref:N-formylglutamate amidohydrolase n=1 Tax=Luteimonas sp. MC1572 TaxID=2799325 RepID=UPI0018F0BBCD|nr:N-formylglutamate amidohydrolase [Luteimonas sp. MC1572]MBJ6980710.1 N-formylglutamate amidohydrolase [Luteimonas sp. MC1572]QQO02084.1 N-formylglutamate amidohydrolase [Luteimonas sp. MC1572]
MTMPPAAAWWTLQRADDAVFATAIHDGHALRPEVAAAMRLPDAERLREEDPFTGQAIAGVPGRVVVHRSRFEVDLNRAADQAVYRVPEQCWGLHLWDAPPDEAFVQHSLRLHHAFYRTLATVFDDLVRHHGRFVVFDVHSYNHRRDGPTAAATPAEDAPEVNIGTWSMPRGRWAGLLDPLMDTMRAVDFNGRHADVRENIAFQGRGELARFVHARYPETGCAIALEFKKTFMDEWTGVPDPAELAAMRRLVDAAAAHAREWLAHA